MKFPPIKIIAIDDNEDDLYGLVQGLNRCGIACLQYRYKEGNEDENGTIHCPHVRILFIDLHLTVGGLRLFMWNRPSRIHAETGC